MRQLMQHVHLFTGPAGTVVHLRTPLPPPGTDS